MTSRPSECQATGTSMSRSKSKGTSFETMCVEYLRRRLDDSGIERRALHGNRDMGDIYGIETHGCKGIAECKNHKSWSKADMVRWRAQTVAERENAGADFALLIVHKNGCGRTRIGESHCHMQVRDLERICGGSFTCLYGDSAKDMWICMTLEDACSLMGNDFDETR